MPVELDKITFSDKVLVGKDGVERKQLSLLYVPETFSNKPQRTNMPTSTSPTKPLIRQFPSFIELSLPRESDE